MAKTSSFLINLVSIVLLVPAFLFPPAVSAKQTTYSREEQNLARVPQVRFYDRRLRRVYKIMGRQYKLMYGHAASDGYIFPNERRDLLFHRRHMQRLVIIDRRSHKVKRMYRKLKRKRRKKRTMHRLKKYKIRYEKMIRRFACRYINAYKKRNRRVCRRS